MIIIFFQRHGSFVWDQMSKERTNQFINHYSVITPEEGVHRQEVMEANRLANEAAKLLEDTNIVDTTPLNTQPNPVAPQQSVEATNGDTGNSGPIPEQIPASRKSSGQPSKIKLSSGKGPVLNENAGLGENGTKEPCIGESTKE